MRSKVAVPVEDLTREQLIQELNRLDGVVYGYESKTDQEVREQNKRLWVEIHRQGKQLDDICTTLLHFGLLGYSYLTYEDAKKNAGKGTVAQGVHKLAHMPEGERKAILEQRRRESEEYARRDVERKSKPAA